MAKKQKDGGAATMEKPTEAAVPAIEKKTERPMLNLAFHKMDKGGSAIYKAEGIRASIYINKGFFAGGFPKGLQATIVDAAAVEGDAQVTFATPGPVVPPVNLDDPEAKAKAIAKAQKDVAAASPTAVAAAQAAAEARAAKAKALLAQLGAPETPAATA